MHVDWRQIKRVQLGQKSIAVPGNVAPRILIELAEHGDKIEGDTLIVDGGACDVLGRMHFLPMTTRLTQPQDIDHDDGKPRRRRIEKVNFGPGHIGERIVRILLCYRITHVWKLVQLTKAQLHQAVLDDDDIRLINAALVELGFRDL